MTDEIIKLYENAGVKKQIPKICSSNELYCKECKAHIEDAMPYCKNAEYPPFTAEKLIKLEMFLINKGDFDIKKGSVDITFESFTSCIAGLINNLWQDLTSEEKQQVKGILE